MHPVDGDDVPRLCTSDDETHEAEAAVRRVFEVGVVSRDYDNRRRRRRRDGAGDRPGPPSWRRYLEDVTVRRPEPVRKSETVTLCGYVQGSGKAPTPGQVRYASRFLEWACSGDAALSGELVPVGAVELAEEILAAAAVFCSTAHPRAAAVADALRTGRGNGRGMVRLGWQS